MKEAKPQQNVTKRRFTLKNVIALLLVLLLAIAVGYYVITGGWDTQVYTYSTVPSPDVTLDVSINNTGYGAITLLDSREGIIKFIVNGHGFDNPRFFMQSDSGRLYANLRIDSNIRDFESFVYLPPGPSYNVTITCRDFDDIKGRTVNRYKGGNLTLWVNDTVRGLYRYPGST